MKYHQKYGWQENSTTYCSESATPYITQAQSTKERRAASPFPLEGWPQNSQGLPRTTLTFIATKIYNALQRNSIEPKYLVRTKMVFDEIDPRHLKFWLSVEFLNVFVQKHWGNTIIRRLLQGIWLHIHRGIMEQILLAYGFPKETVTAIMMLFKNTKVKVRSPDGDTDYCDIVTGVLQGDTLAPYLFIICLDYELKTSIDLMKENDLKLAKERSIR